MCTTAGPRRPIGSDPTRSSPARWTGPTAISPRRSVPRKCGTGTGSIRAPSRLRPVPCTRRSALACRREWGSGFGARGLGVQPLAPSPEPLTPMLRIRAGSVHPVTAPPIEDGAVLVNDRGIIDAVGPQGLVPTPPGVRELAFPEASLVPGLVNTHTHLELTHLAGQNAAGEFAGWIRALRALKDATTQEEFSRSAERGVRDAWAAGVTCVADTGSTGAPLEALARLGGRGIYYHEVFGPDAAQARASMVELERALDRLGGLASARLRLGVSPHAPYTVSERLYRAVDDPVRGAGLPVAMHPAETRAETPPRSGSNRPVAHAPRGPRLSAAPVCPS